MLDTKRVYEAQIKAEVGSVVVDTYPVDNLNRDQDIYLRTTGVRGKSEVAWLSPRQARQLAEYLNAAADAAERT